MNILPNLSALSIGIIAIFSIFLGGLFAIRLKDRLHLILGFSAGAVIAVALFDLLPESFDLTTGTSIEGLVPLLIAVGFLIYMILDRSFSLHSHCDQDCNKKDHKGSFANIMLVIHSFFDGLVIGLSFKVSPAVGWTVAVAVLAHDFSDGINTANMVLRRHGTQKETLKWVVMDAFAPLLGVISTTFIFIDNSVLGIILSIFTGSFLYLGASDLIPESHHQHPTVWTSVATVIGVIVLYLAIRLAGV